VEVAFDRAFAEVIGVEGGYQTLRNDRGNWTSGRVGEGELKGTKYGIAAHAYPDLDIANLTLDQAKAIYRRDYWDRVRGDAFPESVAAQLFDAAVNHGTGAAIKMLQRAAGVADDGAIGPMTLGAVHRADERQLLAHFNAERLDLYTVLPTWPSFGRGWVGRIIKQLRKI
jgi:lysozyme family protein